MAARDSHFRSTEELAECLIPMLGVFNLMALAQFGLSRTTCTPKNKGKRLFPILGIGSSLGALAGAHIASLFFSDLGVTNCCCWPPF